MTEQQNQMITPILETIQDEKIRAFAYVLVDNIPNYIWEVGASSTNKYHPAYSLGKGGLMRHQIAVVRFLNYFFELEQNSTKFTSKEMDLMRVAGLVHDSRKSGEQSDYEHNKYTKFDHPVLMANAVRSYDGKYLTHDDIEFIAHCIESHMGMWNTDKRSRVVLPKPTDEYQCIVHLADYLASRKDLTMAFDASAQPAIELPNVNEYILDFGKYKGKKLVDMFKYHRDYLEWCKENFRKEPLMSLIKLLEEQEKNLEDDEI